MELQPQVGAIQDFENKTSSSENLIEYLRLKRGREIMLVKRSLIRGNSSQVNVGDTRKGKLARDVCVGEPIQLTEGQGNTSGIEEIYQEGHSYFAKTETSIYEIIPVFEGLELKNELGEISLPKDAKSVEINDDIVDLSWGDRNSGENYHRVYINKPALKDALLEVHGGDIFRAVQGRFMVIAKVKNIHLPFYISSSGASGKNEGEWYPFFGYTGNWLIKGGVVKDGGKMEYHPEISKIQELLNKNLIIPSSYLSVAGKFGSGIPKGGVEPAKVYFDINDHLKYQNFFLTEYKNDEKKFVERISGYRPAKVVNDGTGLDQKWIKNILSSIRTD